jgi:hypothetical protein
MKLIIRKGSKMKIEPFKMKCNAEQFIKVQEILFKNGYTWISGENEIKNVSYLPPIAFDRSWSGNKSTLGYIGVGSFTDYPNTELTYSEFINKYDK